MIISKKYTDRLEEITGKIKDSYNYFMENYKRFDNFKKFIFETSLSQEQKNLLKSLQKPILEFNMLEAYLSRLLGEFSKQEPSFKSRPIDFRNAEPQLLVVIEGICRAILDDSNQANSFQYDIYKDQMAGGFGVGKVYTEYEHEMSMEQIIRLCRCEPTLCGFDKLARDPHKGDGKYCFEVFTKYAEDFEKEFGIKLKNIKYMGDDTVGGFKWSYKNSKNEGIVLVGDYYEKVPKKVKIVQLTNNKVMTEEDYEQGIEQWASQGMIEQPPQVKKKRETYIDAIQRYLVIENEIIKHEKTDYKYLPYVFFDGNSALIKTGENSVTQMTRPYLYHAKDNQKLRNFSGQTLANRLENMIEGQWKAAKESIPDEYKDGILKPQSGNPVIYNAFDPKNPDKPLPPPEQIAPTPIPPEIAHTFEMTTKNDQNILGSYDAALGINQNQLSGVAIVEGATQSNATAMPYIVSHMQGLSQIARICTDLLPKYYVTPRTVPIITPEGKHEYAYINQPQGVNMNYQSHMLNVRVEAGASFAIQKSRAINQIIAASKQLPIMNEFLSQMPGALDIILDNFEIRNVEQLQELAREFIQERKMQQAQAAKAAQNQPNPIDIKMAEIKQKDKAAELNYQSDLQKAQNDNLKIQLDATNSHNKNIVDLAKAEAETMNDKTELAIQDKRDWRAHMREIAKTYHQQ